MGHRQCPGLLRRRRAPANANCASNTRKSASIVPPPPPRWLLMLSFVGGLARLAPAGGLARLSSVIFTTNASLGPALHRGCSEVVVGKSLDFVCPMTYAAPVRSTA